MVLGFPLLEHRRVVHREPARQKIDLAGVRLGREEARGREIDEEPVDIGKLAAFRIDAVKIRVALEDEAIGGRPGHDLPGIQRRHVRIGVVVRVVEAVEQGGPAPELGFRGALGELVGRGVTDVEGLEVMGGRADEDGARLRERGEEQGIGLVPAIAHVPLVEDLEARELAVDIENRFRPGR